ncbi:helix-turn-helix transcriptional regulator [Paenibacillus antri]|uniref:Helix-turn-helix transcriptional regulator n=1 Tax=Paenibacillus antri TaxID=2582848 RepID=A0A5R9G8Y0_9BACL|nr:helix-turn-helix transcriptional regulator [Paenibacillus antri]TLS52872.1 helix-turn-helix transcriptional regulator [Paenibacillus antri]
MEPFPMEYVRGASPGTVIYNPGGAFGPRLQLDVQFVLLHTGAMRVEIDGVPLDCPPGRVAMLLPGRTETFAFHRTMPTWHRWIAVEVNDAAAAARLLEPLPRVQPLTEEFNRLADLLLSLRDKERLADGVAKALGLAAVRLYAEMASRSPKTTAAHESVTAAKAAAHRRFGEDLTLDELAKEAGVSPEHLVRLFKRHENTTPMRYVWQYRVLAAHDMLVHTGLSVGEIAARCGFKTSYHFARMFKQRMGKSPSQVRKESWQGLV